MAISDWRSFFITKNDNQWEIDGIWGESGQFGPCSNQIGHRETWRRYRFHICLAYVSGLCIWGYPHNSYGQKSGTDVQYLHLLDPGDLPLIQVCYPLVIEHNNTTIWRIIIFNRTKWAMYTTAKSFPRATYVWFSNTLVTARGCPI